MSYVQEVLLPGEELKYQGVIHWVTYLHGIAWLLAALIVWIIVPASWGERFVVRAVIIVLATAGVFWLGRAAFHIWITEIAVTNRRVIYKCGLVSRTTAEMHMRVSRLERIAPGLKAAAAANESPRSNLSQFNFSIRSKS